ncbi:E3 ubiquitin-protein transferase Katazuke [Arctopsyche grandis]|uniref:E3 ubiquitin-protein transferase Katazuke n=1 Tax=Arctopsyche grandis TaxID=121162 RepID=UPI00406D8419
MNDIKSLEHPTLKVPYEIFNKKYRQAQKTLDSEVRQVQNVVNEIESGLNKENVPAEEITRLLGGMVERLQTMKRKASEAVHEELRAGCVCKRRLEHLKEHAEAAADANTLPASLNQWRKIRLDRMLIEYLLRHGYYKCANELADKTSLRDLTNVDIFMVAREVEQDLFNRDTGRCLQWCADNKSKLRKLKSSMEFKLRVQDYVELVREDKGVEAVKYAKKYFAAYEDGQLLEIQQCMGMLAFPSDTEVQPYKALFDEGRWQTLVQQFRQENYRLLQLPSQTVFSVALQAGLSALKTPYCYSVGSRVASCPVCCEPLNSLAACLPHAHCSQSRLVCRISGDPLNENNHPMMLPNGHVYGEKALKEMMREQGAITCPKTKAVFSMKEVEKVFVM